MTTICCRAGILSRDCRTLASCAGSSTMIVFAPESFTTYAIRSGGYVGYTGTVMQPALKIAKSAWTHSARLVDSSATASPGWRPSEMSPSASSRTTSATSRHVSVVHAPWRFDIWAGRSALLSTRLQNIVARVSFIALSLHLQRVARQYHSVHDAARKIA